MRVCGGLCLLTEITEPQTWERSLRFICPCRADFSQSTSLSSWLYSFHAFSISCGTKQDTFHVIIRQETAFRECTHLMSQCYFEGFKVPLHYAETYSHTTWWTVCTSSKEQVSWVTSVFILCFLTSNPSFEIRINLIWHVSIVRSVNCKLISVIVRTKILIWNIYCLMWFVSECSFETLLFILTLNILNINELGLKKMY